MDIHKPKPWRSFREFLNEYPKISRHKASIRQPSGRGPVRIGG